VNKAGPVMPGMTTPCWEWSGAKDGHRGYGHVWVQGRKLGWAHRVAWELVNGEIPRSLHVLHRCDNPRCVRAEPDGGGHLFVGTKLDNARDMITKGRAIWQGSSADEWRAKLAGHGNPAAPKGEANARARLTEDAVRDILAARAAGVTLTTLAVRHGVTKWAISKVANRRNWRHVEPQAAPLP
jgi:hypothetical protein